MRIWINEIPQYEDKKVELVGWVHNRRDHGKLVFIDLRDRSGIVQVVFIPKSKGYDTVKEFRSEWVVKITGTAQKRPKGAQGSESEMDAYEIFGDDAEIITRAETPPIHIDSDGKDIGEESRMKYRYLDLRRRRMLSNIENRHKVIQYIRNFLTEKKFIEVETPILGKSTPEGARDYLVPSRLHAGEFYALPQSPQQYKQLLMVGGIERYFQIARCFRDEDTRGDRQAEFTQLDVEMSFVSQEDVLSLVEEMFTNLIKELYPEKTFTFDAIPRLSYKEVMEKYKSDKPDLRKDKNDPNELAFAFVVDFPMFEWRETENRWDAVHHPFTRPQQNEGESLDELIGRMKKDPGELLAHQYDFVLNGYEIAGGSIRTHEAKLLTEVFKLMGHTEEGVKEQFGHLLEAFSYGVPPHGGIAPGIDRVLMILQNEPNIREVIAFPKTGDGRDLMMGAPGEVEGAQLQELHIDVSKEQDENS